MKKSREVIFPAEMCLYDYYTFEELNKHAVDLGDFDEFYENGDNIDLYDAWRYVAYLVLSYNEDDTSRYINETVGKYLDEIDIPKTAFEEPFEEGY